MKHRGFILLEALISALLIGVLVLCLLQAYGSSLFSMQQAKIFHERFNNEELSKAFQPTP